MRNEVEHVTIGSTGADHLTLTPIWRAYPTATDYWDGNWLRVKLELRAGAFQGKQEALLRTDEFASFRSELGVLHDTLRGEAVFASLEGWAEVRLVGDGKGHVAATIKVRDNAGIANSLHFGEGISIDQTDLPRLIDALDGVLRTFPVIGDPGR
ncbi:MAG: hypothetical protein ACJAYU_000453 [Bradymonadia bacterium]|jgi:hypothetical protein